MATGTTDSKATQAITFAIHRSSASTFCLPLGDSVFNVWESLLLDPGSFLAVKTEDLFGTFLTSRHSQALASWLRYIRELYGWATQ